MKALLVARKSLVELLREWQLLLLVLLLPLVFLAITAFGYSAPLQRTHRVLVMDGSQGSPLVAEWEAQQYADGRPVFEIEQVADPGVAEAALMDQEAAALLTISTEQHTRSSTGVDAPPLVLTIKGDALYAHFYRASVLLENVTTRHADRVAGRPDIIRIEEQSLGKAGPQSEFDIYAPGMMIFALLLIIPQTAMLVAREVRWNTLQRLRLTPLHAWELLGGVSLSQMAVAVVQVVLIFVSALAMGFHNQGSLGLAIVVGLAVSFSAIGLGLIVACFVENDSQAINVGSTVAMIIVFVSGAFYQIPPLTVFTLAGHQIDLFDIFPATHGFVALVQVLGYGDGLREIAFRLGAAVFLSLLYFGLGVAIFQRLRLRERV